IDALQHAETIDTVVLDKTGTITRGKPAVAEVAPLNGVPADELLARAAAAEMFSEHPLAKAIVAHAQRRGLPIPQPTSFNNEPGLGVLATVDGQELLVGNAELLTRHGARLPANGPAVAQTLVYVAGKSNGSFNPLGWIALVDEIKPD